MADAMINGNSTVAGCRGTYRNGSDVTTDLIYSVTPETACNAVSRRGYTISRDARTLTFVFATGSGPNGGFGGGERFEWDTDTDGGGVAADAHAGTVVDVWVRNPTSGAVSRSTGAMVVVSAVDPVQEAAVVF
jgi:hypothetical protein